MARKATGKKVGRPKSPAPKRNIITLRGSEEWRVWLHGLAAHCRLPASTLIDHALVAYARQQGYSGAPPER